MVSFSVLPFSIILNFRDTQNSVNRCKTADKALAIPHTRVNITKPVLLLTAAKDPIGTPARAEAGTRPYASDLRIQQIDSGHFMMLEKAKEVNEAMRAFFES